jgi:asparagine synthase (glutamine-hydrolysing)
MACLQNMISTLAHRGPAGQQTWQNENATALLGHQRLSIIDLSPSASQPMHYKDRYTIIHNGEIYNYIELRQELEQIGYQFQTRSDTEVILAAYDHWADECPVHFDGMFAFAIWDKEEEELFAARDRFGEKPFFYSRSGNQFHFASEMKALWAAGIPRESNLKMLFNYITIGYLTNPERAEETFFENIFKLPAASLLYYTPSDGNLYINTYWEIDPEKQNKIIKDREAINTFQSLLTTSVERRLRSDVTVGTSLSGGLDSSAIVGTLYDLPNPPRNFSSFTASFPGFEKDELSISSKIAGAFNIRQHVIRITAEDMINEWEKFIYHQEEPIGSAGVFAQYKVFELARQKDVTVLLDGQGADETLAGYHKYYKWYWQELFRRRKLTGSGELSAARKNGITEKFGVKNIIAALFPDLASVLLEKRYLINSLNHQHLNKGFVQFQSKEAYYSSPPYPGLNGRLHFNTFMHGLEELLRYADRNSMAHGREVRLPFLSHDLVEFIFSLPANFKIRNGWTKWLLRMTMDKKLPDVITWRRDKTGFEAPQKTWMQQKKVGEMVQAARQKLVNEKILDKAILNTPLQPTASYDSSPFDWRYLSAAACI